MEKNSHEHQDLQVDQRRSVRRLHPDVRGRCATGACPEDDLLRVEVKFLLRFPGAHDGRYRTAGCQRERRTGLVLPAATSELGTENDLRLRAVGQGTL